MKFWTIWTIPAMTLRERLHRTWDDWFLQGLAARMPKRLAFWVVIHAGAYTSRVNPNQIVPEMTFFDVLEAHPGGKA
jgi:hypothetical protein